MYDQNWWTYVFLYFVSADLLSEDQLCEEEKHFGPCSPSRWDADIDWLTYILLVAWRSRTLDICAIFMPTVSQPTGSKKRSRLWRTFLRLILSCGVCDSGRLQKHSTLINEACLSQLFSKWVPESLLLRWTINLRENIYRQFKHFLPLALGLVFLSCQ